MTECDKRIDPTEKVAIASESGYMQMVSVKGLADKGYRKEEELRKEILQDVFFAICHSNQTFDRNRWFDGEPFCRAIEVDDIKEIIKQEFGVEVEEW